MSTSNSHQPKQFSLTEKVNIQLASKEQAKQLLSTPDSFTNNFSLFDLQARLQDRTAQDTSLYLQQIGAHAEDWSTHDQKLLGEAIGTVSKWIDRLDISLHLPEVITLVKTDGKEEGGAAYTRGEYIVLTKKQLNANTLAHELFHVFSRYNPDIRQKLYAIIGFKPCQPITYPEELAQRIITNPDAPINNYYITVYEKGTPLQAMMITYSDKHYKKGNFFEYLHKGLLIVSIDENGIPTAVMEDGKPKILRYNEVSGLYNQIGKNTNYNIHPEEVCAEHFMMLLAKNTTYSHPDLVDQMEDVLRSTSTL